MDKFQPRTTPETPVFEASDCYFSNRFVPARMEFLRPRANLIITLEDPILRAYSVYEVTDIYRHCENYTPK